MEWAPSECALPTGERPLRVAEFDALFASALGGLERVSQTHLRLSLRDDGQGDQADQAERTDLADRTDEAHQIGPVEEVARDLVARETACCSFFTFTFTRERDGLVLDVEVPVTHGGVLDGLAARALAAAPRVSS
ncbi:hypothetical protein [Streptosporangium vulgare]|uniref:Uncharacterized protein n=1 Tax=Streptosporangium vulgare TaxID=46190 RepID=A0ABV5THP9_9ACTN